MPCTVERAGASEEILVKEMVGAGLDESACYSPIGLDHGTSS